MKIGFIGQGWIGKNYSDDFEERGYDVVRYALEPAYAQNKELIKDCDIVFVAVPTPTTPEGFNIDTVRAVLPLVGKGNTVVIKSTILPGTTNTLAQEFPDIYVTHSPEFLVEKTAGYDARNPNRNIVGIPEDTPEYRRRAQAIIEVLPKAPFESIMRARDAECVKYAGNCFLFTKVLYMNVLYDLIEKLGGDWTSIKDAFIHDPRIGISHTEPVHQSGRGAGGHCFIKDFEAFRLLYEANVGDTLGNELLNALTKKNIALLVESNKDIDLLTGVYGDLEKFKA